MSLFQALEENTRMDQELSEVLERVIRHIGEGTIGSLESINSSEAESIIKLVEGTVMRTLHCVIQPALEELIRSVAKGVIDTAIGNILTGNPPIDFHFSEQRRLRLKFKYKLFLPLWTGIPIKSEMGTSLEVTLVDDLTGEIIDSGPEASAKVEIVVIKGENDYTGGFDFEGFNRNIVRERKENKPLLGGDVHVNLKEGIGCLSEIYFAHSSNWMKNCSFRLGARIVGNIYGNKVREAITESFIIRDRRTKLYEKHEIPSLSDAVWRLKNINRRGALYKRLREGNIKTVQGFLTEHFINPQRLGEICGTAFSGRILEETVAHAMKCELSDRYLYYSSCGPHKIGAIFNVVGQLLGAIYEPHYVPIDELSEKQKIEARVLVTSAFKHWAEVILVDKNFPSFDGSDISNAFCAPNSHELDVFEPQNDGAHIMIENHENTFSCNSYPDITSSNPSDWSMNTIDDIGTYFESTYAPSSSFLTEDLFVDNDVNEVYQLSYDD